MMPGAVSGTTSVAPKARANRATRGFARRHPEPGSAHRIDAPVSVRWLAEAGGSTFERGVAVEAARRERRTAPEPPEGREEPLPAPARGQSRGLVPLGRGGLREGAARGQARVPFHRLLHLPLVPRDGGGVLRGPRGGEAHERGLRVHQGRPRGAARPRRSLHGREPGAHGRRRVAAHDRDDPRREAVLRGDLLSRGRTPTAGRACSSWCRASASCGRAAATTCSPPRIPSRRRSPGSRRHRRRARAFDEASLARAARAIAAGFDAEHGGFGGAPKFPMPTVYPFLLRAWRRSGDAALLGMVGKSLAAMRQRRHLRPARVRVPPLRDGRGVARAPFREDALRPGAARAGVHGGLAGHGGRLLSRDGARGLRLRAAGPAFARGRVLRRGGRGQRGRGGEVLPVERAGDRGPCWVPKMPSGSCGSTG